MLSAGPAVVDVYKLAAQTGVKIDADAYVPSIRGYYALNNGADGRAALQLLDGGDVDQPGRVREGRAGPDQPPATWPEVIAAARAIKEKNAAPIPMMTAWPTWAHFEQFAAIHNVEYATLNDGFAGNDPKLTDRRRRPSSRHLQRLLDAEKEGIFKYVGRDGTPSPSFLCRPGRHHLRQLGHSRPAEENRDVPIRRRLSAL